MSSSEDDDDQGKRRTDCCGAYADEDDTEECPDCGHVVCGSCEVSANRGMCRCKFSIRGDAVFDQTSPESRSFARSISGFSGSFKSIPQARMEKDLVKGRLVRVAKRRVDKCGYSKCTTLLTDDNLKDFVLCEVCQSVAYCSAECRAADAENENWDVWDGVTRKHADICEPFRHNDSFPYVAIGLRKYKEEFGRYPHPLGREDDIEDLEAPRKRQKSS